MNIKTLIIILLLPLSIFSQNLLTFDIDYEAAHTLQKNVYGGNNEMVYQRHTPNNTSFKELYNDLGNPTFRYPAGTASNYLNMLTGMPEAWDGASQSNLDRLPSIMSGLENNGKSVNGVDYREYAKFLISTKAKTNYIVNLSSMSVEQNRQVLQDIKDLGATIGNFELCNEIFYGTYSSRFDTVDEYITIAKEATIMIKSIFPDAKIAVVIPAEYYTDEEFLEGDITSNNRKEVWYHELMQNDFYDALAIHLYSKNGMTSTTSEADFLSYEASYTYATSHSDCRIHSTFEHLSEDFPNKEVWITEYHVGGFSTNLSSYRLRYSYLGGLFASNFMLKLFSKPQVTISSWHATTQMYSYSGVKGQLLPDNCEFQKNINYYFFKIFKDPVAQSNQYIPVTVGNAMSYEPVEEFSGQCNEVEAGLFYNEITSKGSLLVFNKMNHIHIINKEELESSLLGSIIEIKEIRPDVTLSTTDGLETETSATITANLPINDNLITLQAYSAYTIKYARTLDASVSKTTFPDIKFKVFPNPTSGHITVSTDFAALGATWKLLNLSGTCLSSGRINNIDNHLLLGKYLQEGTYLFLLSLNKTSKTQLITISN